MHIKLTTKNTETVCNKYLYGRKLGTFLWRQKIKLCNFLRMKNLWEMLVTRVSSKHSLRPVGSVWCT